ncbi:MAG TPA: hypothetical protein PLR37_16615 [Candidatus Accumulibacter phosphatis]|uniref:hypothetical protein n=1 Tax=Accumulibacter sp. TaxID=2053492 RepID=UPI001A51D254|nr:hypothetical protein [Accumulibacter sp.]MBL8406916.1 hypothetical protein [Accumulibacter sp.]HRF13710.1 hypothetical protein [Candidatus Accumulibacter phosphatis]
MNSSTKPPDHGYFPAIVCVECDSPIDALVALCIPRHEATDLVAASWVGSEPPCLVAVLDGGRPVVVLPTPEGRWAACNAFLNDLCATHQEADRRLARLLKRHRHGYVACLRQADLLAADARSESLD